jgi:hypothetical protein
MTDRLAWLEEWCPHCGAAPGARCGHEGKRRRAGWAPLLGLHVARGWRVRRCPTCRAGAGEACRAPSGRAAHRVHAARLHPGRAEIVGSADVWEELERREVVVAVVLFSGRAGRGGTIGRISFSQRRNGDLVDVEQWERDELACALEAPVWDRYGTFAGQPFIRGEVIWTVEDRTVVIAGRRGEQRYRELVGWPPA